MELFKLAAWGAGDKQRTRRATSIIAARRQSLLWSITSKPNILAQAMRDTAAVFSGDTALHFFDSSNNWNTSYIDIYAPYSTWGELLDHLLDRHHAEYGHHPEDNIDLNGMAYYDYTTDAMEERADFLDAQHHRALCPESGLAERMVLDMPAGVQLTIWRSKSESAFLPIVRSWSTLFMNWVGPDSCGCAYPSLTSRRRGLIGYRAVNPQELRIMNTYLSRGYDFRFHTDDWSTHAHVPFTNNAPTPTFRLREQGGCPKETFCCPSQSRYFGDDGSFIYYLNTRATTPAKSLPQGIGVLWRLTNRSCDAGCHSSLPLEMNSMFQECIYMRT